ncbi:MAG TPA: OmpA family protein [Steroidobacteraceae bacterium]|nr:OmpA family protein [Steroidobacteraceae bacterium]
MKYIKGMAVSAALALVAACATTPTVSPEVSEAHARVESLAQSPLAGQVANEDLTAARSALAQAEAAQSKHEDAALVSHLAYIARRNADIGLERVQEAEAKQRISKAESDRNAVLMQARTAETQSAKADAEASRQSALQAHAELEDLQQQYQELAAKQTERGMVLTLGDVLFDTAQATLKPGAATIIERLSTFLNQNAETRIRIEGHTDSVGSEAYNEELSRRRAQAVADALADRGIARDRIDVAARGEGFPVVGNETAAGRQQNRRVEIVFSGPEGTFAKG